MMRNIIRMAQDATRMSLRPRKVVNVKFDRNLYKRKFESVISNNEVRNLASPSLIFVERNITYI